MLFVVIRLLISAYLLECLSQQLYKCLTEHVTSNAYKVEIQSYKQLSFTGFNSFSSKRIFEIIKMYVLFVAIFLLSLYCWENLLSVIYRRPRKLSLTNNYIDARPKKVDKSVALQYDTPLTAYEIFKLFFFGFTGILFIRIILYVVMVMIGFVLVSIAGWLDRKAHPLWFTFWHTCISVLMHVALFSLGIYNVKIYGTFASEKRCKLIICNHSCVTEVMITSILSKFPSFVSRRENCKIPLFASAVKTCGMISVDRDTTSSRQQAITAIRECASSVDDTQLLIFPEGTTSNQHTLFMFKKGAFEAGQSVQMVCVAFPYCYFNPAWTGRAVGGNNVYQLLLRLCSQFVNHCELRILPVYEPSLYEKNDSVLYANHCQRMMAAVLCVNISDATLHDYLEMEYKYENKRRR